jgi:23S rRNA pseudouridine955/2504/2580 synthase/23S rRNA pseudouridine1911/1915/1917 synthase
MESWRVTPDESGYKLQTFLRNKLGTSYSGKAIKLLIDSGHCALNGRPERFANSIVGRGDQVTLHLPTKNASSALSELLPMLSILLWDDHLIAIDKPAGVASDSPALLAAVRRQTSPTAQLIHRLDRCTSGALIFAATDQSAAAMKTLFQERGVHKEYWALTDGIPKVPTGTVHNQLACIQKYQGQSRWGVVPVGSGREAITHWKVLKRGKGASLLLCQPVTGRTHQIRIHLSDLGHPILGDSQYGKQFSCSYHPERCLLHAHKIAFRHPILNHPIAIEAPLPRDFLTALKAVGCQ